MCTAIAYKGNDLIYGFNLDIDPKVWNYDVYMTKKYFSVGITVGSTTYLTHGITADGIFANIPYMNGPREFYPVGTKKHRIDLVVNKILRGKMNISEVKEILCADGQSIASPKNLSFHSLFGDSKGDFLLVEPGIGYRDIKESYGVVTNFPVLREGDYSDVYYGSDRYEKAKAGLETASSCFNAENALDLLHSVSQEGEWATRVTFAYSQNENTVYYYLNNDRENVKVHKFSGNSLISNSLAGFGAKTEV